MMTEKCLDSGAVQAFLDGELDGEQSEMVAHHVAACDDCATMLAEAEEESSFTFSALEQEFNTLVPTHRLWTKINDSIEQEKQSFWTPIFAFFKQPSTAAFAGLLIIAGLFAVIIYRGNVDETKLIAENYPNKTAADVSAPKSDESNLPPPQITPPEELKFVAVSNVKDYRSRIRVVESKPVKANRKPNVNSEKPEIKNEFPPPANETLTGEDSYLKTIATLSESVNNRKDEVLKPSARFAFERDLAVADNAIKTMKAEIKQNPKDESAKQILRSSYQNKIDLLSSVADKTELMASLK